MYAGGERVEKKMLFSKKNTNIVHFDQVEQIFPISVLATVLKVIAAANFHTQLPASYAKFLNSSERFDQSDTVGFFSKMVERF